MSPPDTPIYIDLFAGAGGISLGLYNAGWKGLFAIEKSEMAFSTLKHNLIDKRNHFLWPNWLSISEHDIYDILKNYQSNLTEIKNTVSLVAGGPPCQGFSLAGRRKPDDERNKLVDAYIQFIDIVEPPIIFLENVKGFTIGFKENEIRQDPYSIYLSKKLENLGYKIKTDLFDFSNYGIPQKRERFILIGSKRYDPEKIHKKILVNKNSFLKSKKIFSKKVTVKQAISDLEKRYGIEKIDNSVFFTGKYGRKKLSNYQKLMRKNTKLINPDSHRFPNHSGKSVRKFEYILSNCPRNKAINDNIKEMFNLKKHTLVPLSPDNTCPTLTTLPDDYIHYSEPRILTVREYARIQSFNDWYEFKSKYTTGGKLRHKEVPRYTQIGNAVPPLFMEYIGLMLKEVIKNE